MVLTWKADHFASMRPSLAKRGLVHPSVVETAEGLVEVEVDSATAVAVADSAVVVLAKTPKQVTNLTYQEAPIMGVFGDLN